MSDSQFVMEKRSLGFSWQAIAGMVRKAVHDVRAQHDTTYLLPVEKRCPAPELYPDIHAIVQPIADAHGSSMKVLRGPRRDAWLMPIRCEAYCALTAAGFGPTVIGKFFNRNHSTILNGLGWHERQAKKTERNKNANKVYLDGHLERERAR